MEVLITAVVAFIAGGVIAMLILRFLPNKSSELITSSQKERANQKLKKDVTPHFVKTAELSNDLARAYHNLHNHLAEGAQTFCQDGQPGLTPIMRKYDNELPFEDPTKNLSADSIRAPLDYAPKMSPDSKGVLSEDFALDKKY